MQTLQTIFETHFQGNDSIEEVLLRLRNAGATQKDSVKILQSNLSLTLAEADEIVLHSHAWKDLLESNLKFREEFVRVLGEEWKEENLE